MKRRSFLAAVAAACGLVTVAGVNGQSLPTGEGIQQVECRGMYFAIKTDAQGEKWYYPMSDIEIGCPAVTVRRFEGIDGRYAITVRDLDDPRDSKEVSEAKRRLYDLRCIQRKVYRLQAIGSNVMGDTDLLLLGTFFADAAQSFDEACGIA